MKELIKLKRRMRDLKSRIKSFIKGIWNFKMMWGNYKLNWQIKKVRAKFLLQQSHKLLKINNQIMLQIKSRLITDIHLISLKSSKTLHKLKKWLLKSHIHQDMRIMIIWKISILTLMIIQTLKTIQEFKPNSLKTKY